MRRYGRVEFLAMTLLALLLAVVLYASAGCSERRDRTYYVTSPAPAGSDSMGSGDSCPVPKHRKHKRHN